MKAGRSSNYGAFTIKGEAKEIADLLLAVEDRQKSIIVEDVIREITSMFQDMATVSASFHTRE